MSYFSPHRDQPNLLHNKMFASVYDLSDCTITSYQNYIHIQFVLLQEYYITIVVAVQKTVEYLYSKLKLPFTTCAVYINGKEMGSSVIAMLESPFCSQAFFKRLLQVVPLHKSYQHSTHTVSKIGYHAYYKQLPLYELLQNIKSLVQFHKQFSQYKLARRIEYAKQLPPGVLSHWL